MTLSKQTNTILGLTVEGGVLNAVELKRTNGSAHVLKQVTAPLMLDPLRDEPELVGREIRNVLNGAQISTKRCVAGVPAGWALTVHTKLPPVEGDDLASFLEIEAERGFACSVDELQLANRIHPGGFATIIGLPKAYLDRFQAVLAAAELKIASISIGVLALPDGQNAGITAEIADSRINVVLASTTGIVALRTLEGAFDSEGAEKRVQGELLARDLRITLGQLAPEIRGCVRSIHVFGDRRYATQLTADLETRLSALDLQVKHIETYDGSHHGMKLDGNASVSSALSLAAASLGGAGVGFEFLPPKPTFWQQFSSKYSSRGLAYSGGAAGAILLLVAAGFIFQQWQLARYRAQWASIRSKVTELEDLQNNVRRFRPWSDTGLRTMLIMRRMTEAFPEEGIVSAKLIEIRDSSVISCTGTAKDHPSLLATIDRLRSTPQVHDLRVDQIRGKSPLQFTFNFQWGALTDEN